MTQTIWNIVGITGTLLFSGRWVLQMWQSHKAERSITTEGFWYISIAGNSLILSYFIFGNHDSIGILSNLFPMAVAFYNLFIIFKAKRI